MANATNNKGMSNEQMAGIGAVVGAVATAGAAAVGYYFYASKDAVKHRKIAKKWAKDLKDDVVKQAKKVKQLDSKVMTAIVAEAGKKYKAVKNIDPTELAKATKELKSNWKKLAEELGKGAQKTSKAVQKSATKGAKTVKKAVKKAVAKKK
jgi:hypothetical protein